jgi:hypothetical protein
MDFSIEKNISIFVRNQFPQFYQEEGENFILFTKAYYEWMESEGNPVAEARDLLNYRDIDNTIEPFLEYFQKKYLYGIPFNIISNKRFLLKHILDVYRSKGTIQCYRLLFRLIYDEDIKVYLPSNDMLRVSDGTWKIPTYLEITHSSENIKFVGKTVIGTTSGTTAVVESYITQLIDKDEVGILFISNILPKGGEFLINEKIVLESEKTNFKSIQASPNLLGSLKDLTITDGGQDFKIGDILKIAYKDPVTNQIISHGVNGLVRVTDLARSDSGLTYTVINGGGGYKTNALTFLYANSLDTGTGSSFAVGSITDTQSVTYNTDLICDHISKNINATAYVLANVTANLTTNVGVSLGFLSNTFGTIDTLTSTVAGSGYKYQANTFVRTVMLSNTLPGAITYGTSSYNLNGFGTKFKAIFNINDTIWLKANTSSASTVEYGIVQNVLSDTQIVLYAKPTHNSTASATYKAAPTIFGANFTDYEPVGSAGVGNNAVISAFPSTGFNVIGKVEAIDSGRGYIIDESVKLYLYGGINIPEVVSPGSGYKTGDKVIVTTTESVSPASGQVIANTITGAVESVILSTPGSGYSSVPRLSIKSDNGTGASLRTTLVEFNTFSEVTGTVNKKSIGSSLGYWSTTRGFLNSDKYIQDSYYYQDYSYEIRVPLTLETYKEVLYNTFHSAGSEMFGKYSLDIIQPSPFDILYDTDSGVTIQINDVFVNLTSDTDNTYVDNDLLSVDTLSVFTVSANTYGVNSTADAITVTDASYYYHSNDYIFYQVGETETAISGLTANSYYYITFANDTHVALSTTKGGSNVNISESRTSNPGEEHVIMLVQKWNE